MSFLSSLCHLIDFCCMLSEPSPFLSGRALVCLGHSSQNTGIAESSSPTSCMLLSSCHICFMCWHAANLIRATQQQYLIIIQISCHSPALHLPRLCVPLSMSSHGAVPLHFTHMAGTLQPFLVCVYFLPGCCAESSQGKGKEMNDEECHCSSKYIGCCRTAACTSHAESACPIFVFIFLLLFSTYISLQMKWTKLHARCKTTFKIYCI